MRVVVKHDRNVSRNGPILTPTITLDVRMLPIQTGTADLVSYEIHRACHGIELAASKLAAVRSLIRLKGAVTQAMKPLLKEQRTLKVCSSSSHFVNLFPHHVSQ